MLLAAIVMIEKMSGPNFLKTETNRKKFVPAEKKAMKLTCPLCQRGYNIDPGKIPSKSKAVKCKTCGHSISLQPSASKVQPAESNTISIICLYCNQKYAIHQRKIPARASVVKCKKCGHSISLKGFNSQPDVTKPCPDKITCLY